jgi:putative acetyltransferase
MILRREQPGDDVAIREVHTAAFGNGAIGTSPVVEALLADELRLDGVIPGLSIVALLDGAIAGHVVCSRGTLAGRPSVGLGPLGVLPGHQRSGVGSALMHAVLGAADALGEPAVFLLGAPAYYRRFGFVLASPLGLEPPDPSWSRHFQVRTLSNWDRSTRGSFAYAAPFDHVQGES